MSNPTSNFGWQMPTPQDLVTDLPADFEVFGQAVDTDFQDLLGGTTGQVLSKTSATDLAFTWVDANPGDITGVTAGTGLTGGGTSGTVTLDIDSTVSTLTGTQTLTNKTLTAPIINLSFNPQTGTSYTLVSGDSGKLVTLITPPRLL
jgi:predicted secreted protein